VEYPGFELNKIGIILIDYPTKTLISLVITTVLTLPSAGFSNKHFAALK
jgi:hypothetical protein